MPPYLTTCEHCGRTGPDVQRRLYDRPAVIDPAASDPMPADYAKALELTLCARCDRESRQPGSETRRWVEKHLGYPL